MQKAGQAVARLVNRLGRRANSGRGTSARREVPEALSLWAQENVRLLEFYSLSERTRLLEISHDLIKDTYFEGAGGVVVTDEIRATIMTHAAILVLNRPRPYYPGLRTVIVYPGGYRDRGTRRQGFIEHEYSEARSGESWSRGTVVLSWDDSMRGGFVPDDGHNVILHEFAHQLDDEFVFGSGTPDLGDGNKYGLWEKVMQPTFETHRRKTALGMPTSVRYYGAQNPAEFFAVLVEAFFETPAQLKTEYVDVYDLLKDYFGQDPESRQKRLNHVSMENDRMQWNSAPEMQIATDKTYIATITTNKGDMKLELYPEHAPKTVNNFVFLAKEGFYGEVPFHRVIPDFVIQGGDPTGTGTGGPGYTFEDETEGNPLKHDRGAISMANAGPDTNGSQFFITDVAAPCLDGAHAVFGYCEPLDVVVTITGVPTDQNDKPLEDVVLESVEITRCE